MIVPVSYAAILDHPDSPALMEEYAEECSKLGHPNPQRPLYALLESAGGFQAFAVYDAEHLIGFASVLMWTLPHFGTRMGATESIFLRIPYRSRGIELMDFVVNYATEKGCENFQFVVPVGSRFDKLLSLYDDLEHTNNVYTRRLR